jgi:hypothetical protein
MAVATKECISSVQTATTTIPRASRVVREPFWHSHPASRRPGFVIRP